jgi:hypothetical protein
LPRLALNHDPSDLCLLSSWARITGVSHWSLAKNILRKKKKCNYQWKKTKKKINLKICQKVKKWQHSITSKTTVKTVE